MNLKGVRLTWLGHACRRRSACRLCSFRPTKSFRQACFAGMVFYALDGGSQARQCVPIH